MEKQQSESVLYKQKMSLQDVNQNSSNSGSREYPKANPNDIEVSFRVDFEQKILKFVEVDGIKDGDNAQLMLFQRSKCDPNCNTQGDCANCKIDMIYETEAAEPKGTVSYEPRSEYLLCFRVGNNPVGALLSIKPENQKVKVQEMGLFAYWFRQWFERQKVNDPTGCVDAIRERMLEHFGIDSMTHPRKPTSEYIPNMQIIYQVKKDVMTVTLPKPDQLSRELELILVAKDAERNTEVSRQLTALIPGRNAAESELNAQRNIPYSLQVKLKNRGDAVELLDFITEKKILRVQEAKDAPKKMNFLMERRVDQRGTFILHITFDEKIVDVGASPVGEFHLDVDVEKNTLTIGSIAEYKDRTYRVEKLLGNPTEGEILNAQKELLFEGGVDPRTLVIPTEIPIERLCDYLISIHDPENSTTLPTTVLAFQKNALFVKEIKSSDVRLHVTVQRQSNASNDRTDNLNNEDPITMVPIRRTDKNSNGPLYCCPFKEGWTKFRILHKVKLTGDIPESMISEHETKDNDFDLSSTGQTKVDTQIPFANAEGELDFHLDVDMNKMQAHLLPNSRTKNDKVWFVVDEKTQKTGLTKTLPCQLNQTIPIQPWCDYSVKVVDGTSLQLMFQFSVTDKEVINAKPSNPQVRITRKQLHD